MRDNVILKSAQPVSTDNRGLELKDSDWEELLCVIHSRHPLTLGTVQRALSSKSTLRYSIKSSGMTPRQSKSGKYEILVLDTCSVEGWHDALEKWHMGNGRAIVLISPEMERDNEILQMLYMGAVGIVAFSEDLEKKLLSAVSVVAEGGYWVKRSVLNEYVKRTSHILRYMASRDRLVTTREGQIIDLLRQGHSNKEIAATLQISERTVKFHVSNVLKKCEIESRRELIAKPFKAESTSVLQQ